MSNNSLRNKSRETLQICGSNNQYLLEELLELLRDTRREYINHVRPTTMRVLRKIIARKLLLLGQKT